MEQEQPGVETLFRKIVSYLEIKLELLKLKTIEKIAEVVSLIISSAIILLILFLFISMLNITLALWIGSLLGKTLYGFLVMTCFYLLVGIIFYKSRKKLFDKPVKDLIIKQILSDLDEDEN